MARCRMCAVQNSEQLDNWTKISELWTDTSETFEQALKDFFNKLLLTHLANQSEIQHVCPSCFDNVQQLKRFIGKIVRGQDQLHNHFKVQCHSPDLLDKNGKTLSRNISLRKRGRPKKDTSKSVVKNLPSNETETRAKRNIRPPARYGNEFGFSSRPLNLKDKVSSATKSDLDGLPEVPNTQEEVNQKQCNLPTEVTAIKNANNKAEDKKVEEIMEDETPGEEAEDQNDTTFNLKTFSRSMKVGHRRKRGRPKKRRGQDFRCDLCNKVYSAYASLMYHRLSHHENTQDFQCTLCKKKFAHKSLLANHMFTHSSIKPFLCDFDECNASFRSRGSLFNHRKAIHKSAPGKSFTCETCGFQFSFKSALLAHQNTHTGAKPFSCQYCDKRFSHRGNLKEHIRIHTKEKPHICKVPSCGKSFTTASQLRTHKMRHVTTKPFLCEDCGRCFSQRVALISHMKCHIENAKTCAVCHKIIPDGPNVPDVTNQQRKPSDRRLFCKCSKDMPQHKEINSAPDTQTLTTVETVCENLNLSSSSSQHNPSNIELNNSEPVADSLVQIVTEDQLAAFSRTAGTANNEDGSIIFLYQSNELYSVAVEEGHVIQETGEVDAIELTDVVPVPPNNNVSVSFEYQVTTSQEN